jgi:Tfp pilus assembly protein PilO
MSKASTTLWRERLSSPLTWHYVGLGALLLITTGLAVRFGLDWAATDTHSADALEVKQVQLAALNLETRPLRGLDGRITKTRAEMKAFLDKRIPPDYSSIENSMINLEVNSGVRLTRVQYSQGLPGQDLTEITMDAAISGDYPSIMHFVNSVERAQTFYVIRQMALTGEQNGLVNLRIRVSTWLRPEDAAASGLPQTKDVSQAGSGTSADSSNPNQEQN